MLAGVLFACLLAALGDQGPIDAAGSCESLSTLSLPNVTITTAQSVARGAFQPPGGGAQTTRSLPAFCRIAATLKPTSDSDIKIELWLPASGWNGKYQAVGNGAFNGSIGYPALMTALTRGYAASSTDTGHTGNTARFASGHPEKVIDFGWRAVHEMSETSKKIIAAYYDAGPRRSYWVGCSAGGRQAMKEAQLFPADFDGIVAGAPGLDWTGRAVQAVRVAQTLESNEAARLLGPQTQLLHRAVLNACDARDGVRDGVIEDPAGCSFDPGVLQCKTSVDAACLSKAQVDTARLLYSSVVNAVTWREIPGLQPGSELGWTDLGWSPSARATGLEHFRFIVFNDPAWTIDRFNVATDVARADEADRDTINALNPDLRTFIGRGGKLIQYHGWADPQISPANSTRYYRSVLETVGDAAKVHAAYRLFMAPGMGHCGGGDGPNTFDMLGALEQWVEAGKAPDRIVASRSSGGEVDRTRPLCPYPQVAVYKGAGSTDDDAHFVCRAR
jgi:feruloyl esterase